MLRRADPQLNRSGKFLDSTLSVCVDSPYRVGPSNLWQKTPPSDILRLKFHWSRISSGLGLTSEHNSKERVGVKTHLKNYVSCVLIGFSSWLLFSCTTSPVTGRRDINLVSEGEEMQLGLASFDQLKTNTPISKDPTINAMVQRVGKQIAAIADKDMPNAKWEFVVFDSKEANAFCLPGGKVGVYTGIMPIAKDDAGLATVMGHEIGHAVAHHGASRMSKAMVSQGVGQAAGALVGTSKYAQYQDTFMSLYGVGSKVAVELPYSRKQESEADEIGIMYMARAGYDPKASVEFWQRFSAYNQQQGGGSQSSSFSKFLSTHPLDKDRIAQLQALLPKAEAEFAKSQTK
jgi:predicted Zn-dependent protease